MHEKKEKKEREYNKLYRANEKTDHIKQSMLNNKN